MRNVRIAAGWLAAAGIAAIAFLAVVTLVAPQGRGPLALVQVVILHLILAGILVGSLVALAVRTRAATAALAALIIVGAARSGSELVSIPGDSDPGERVAVVTWNLELGARAVDEVANPLLEHDADVVALQELTPEAATALDADPGIRARYPFRLLRPDPGTLGMGLLSAFPIVDSDAFHGPAAVMATLELAGGRRMAILNAHPFHAEITTGPFGLPVGYDAGPRDAAIERVRGRIADLDRGGLPFVVAGDFNTAPTEPAYGRLAHGLQDVHVEVGNGAGWTWRPSRFEAFGIGLVRIDLVLVGAGARPAAIAVDCGHPGDHCIVDATVVVP